MTSPEGFQITDDEDLRQYGIYTQEHTQLPDNVLSRQMFWDTQQYDLDVYPDNQTFLLTFLAAIELGSGIDMQRMYGKTPQPVKYVQARRPSQPDFLIDPDVANEVLNISRYRRNSLADDYVRYGMNRHNLYTLQGALMRAGLRDVITMAELEIPLCLSGGVYISPPWNREVIATNPRMLTLPDFGRHALKYRSVEDIEHMAFMQVGFYLLDSTENPSDDKHAFAGEFFKRGYADSAVGVLSLDTVRAHHVVFKEWEELLDKGGGLPHRNNSSAGSSTKDSWWERISPKVVELARLVVSEKIPHSWYNREGEIKPPPSEEDFEF